MINQTELNVNLLLSNLIQTLEEDSLYKRIILSASKKYFLGFLKLETVFPSQVFQFITKLAAKDYSPEKGPIGFEKTPQTSWVLNEFKLFSWMAVCYAYLIGKQLKQFNQTQYTFLNQFFPRKPQKFLEYQIKCLLKYSKIHCQNWNSEEISLLNNIIKSQSQQNNLKWSQISYLLFCESEGKYYRSPQKCREKWINHLDPHVNHTKWSLKEDLKLFQTVSSFGTKWSSISKAFRGTRTEHMVKNRYNSIFKNYQKKSQRTLATKILEKIIDDIERKISSLNVKTEKQNLKLTTDNSSENVESQELLLSEDLTLFKSESSLTSSSSQYRIMDEVTETSCSSIDCLDLNEIMFSEKSIQIESPPICFSEIQMMEIEMFSDFRRAQDSYIESLLFQ